MLKPMKGKPKDRNGFVVLDIENRKDGSTLWIDTCWRDDQGIIQHKHFGNWLDWWQWYIPLAREEQKFRRLWAHNGGGWDWIAFLEWVVEQGNINQSRWIDIVSAGGSSLVMLMVHCKRGGDNFTIQLCDSVQLLRSPLDKIAKTFKVGSKVEFKADSHEELYKTNKELFVKYVENDTEILLKVLEHALDLVRENIAEISTFGPTIGSTALRVWRTNGQEQPIKIPNSQVLKDFLREGYQGGRVEVFKYGVHEDVTVYDINSLYPYSMSITQCPHTDKGTWVKHKEFDSVGVFRVKFYQHDRSIPPVLVSNGKSHYEGEGVFFTPELRLLEDIDPKARISVTLGYIFDDTALLFDKWVNRLYDLRKNTTDEALKLLLKFLLNSCYGKWAQKSDREKLIKFNTANDWLEWEQDYIDKHDEKPKLQTIDISKLIFSNVTPTMCKHEHVGIAGMITSSARVELYKGMASTNGLCYCDTDSVHTTGTISSDLITANLGGYKIEAQGRACYLGKKLYAIKSETGEKIRCKGVSVGGKFGSRVTWDDFIHLWKTQGQMRCSFTRPATFKEVLKKTKKACSFEGEQYTRTRTIRKT